MDYDQPTVYRATRVNSARKLHTCCECRSQILKGEAYEYAFGVWDGSPGSFATCSVCIELRDYMYTHYKDFPFAHGYLFEEAQEEVRNGTHYPSYLHVMRVILAQKKRRALIKLTDGSNPPSRLIKLAKDMNYA